MHSLRLRIQNVTYGCQTDEEIWTKVSQILLGHISDRQKVAVPLQSLQADGSPMSKLGRGRAAVRTGQPEARDIEW